MIPYERIGGDPAVRRLVNRFYDYMDVLPEAAGIRAMHKEDLGEAREKLYEFLSGWLGGPPLYITRYGHPRLRARHLPFPIGESERDQWLLCMGQAVLEVVEEPEFRSQLMHAFAGVADHMRNREG
jgi:hemoglobin